MSGCIVENCTNDSRLIRGYCSTHYRRVQRYGDPSIVNPKRKKREPVECIVPFCNEPDYANKMCKRHSSSSYTMSPESIIIALAFSTDSCEICGKKLGRNSLVLDHNHSNEQARGLLRRSCNSGLGYFYDNPEIMINAANYIEKYS